MKASQIRPLLFELNLTRGAILKIESATEKEAKKLFHKAKYEQKKLMKKVNWNKP